jgi:beta-galactosidase
MDRPSLELGRRVRPRPRAAISRSAPSPRLRVNLNQGWLFRRGESAAAQDWETANLPHSVRLEPANASGGRNYQGVCWYRKILQISPSWKDRTIYLHFEGAMHSAEVYLNDRKIAEHHCGYTPFTIDLTPWARAEAPGNVLAVRLDNSDNPLIPPGKPQRELDFTYFGGLYRNVYLEVLDRLHITDPILEEPVAGGGIFVTYPRVSAESATARIQTEVRNEATGDCPCTVRQELLDPQGALIAETSDHRVVGGNVTFQQTLQIHRPNLWHPLHPHLYALRTTLLDGNRTADEQITRIGIRHVGFDKDDGLFINHEKFLSIGANRHQDHPYVGYALPDSAHRRDAVKLRDAGFTSVRSHYPQSPAFMDACDELGLLAIVSNPGWQFVGDRLFQERAVQNTRRMIRRDRNRPSVILWEAALNESDNSRIGQRLRQAVREEYPGDPCHTSGDHEPALPGGWDVEYLNNDGTKPYWVREWGDHVDNWSDQQSPNRVPRAWGETPMLAQVRAHIARMDETLAAGGRLCGACLWAGIDYQRGYHRQAFHGGALDLFRLPKFNYYFFQSQRPDAPMVFIANFATFFSPTTVTVFSNCQEVRLLVDGKPIGQRKPDAGHKMAHPPFTFEVAALVKEQSTMYMTGVAARGAAAPIELVAQGLVDGCVAATHVVRAPGAARRLILEADLCGRPLIADASDWVRVYARVCDERGTICPFADDLLTFELQGEGAIIGANPAQAEAGIATVLVRGSERPGMITVRAAAFGLAGGEVPITSCAAGRV